MSDIIARAKQVLKGGDWDGSLALESVHAISEETYVYTVQVFMNQHWIFMWSPRTGNSVDGKWHATRELAEKFSEQWQLDYPTRIVRRRVSPVEVVNGEVTCQCEELEELQVTLKIQN